MAKKLFKIFQTACCRAAFWGLALFGLVLTGEARSEEILGNGELKPRQIIFYADHKNARIPVASPQCQALLDDDSNFSVAQFPDYIDITAKQQNERNALLIVSCPEGDSYYSLSYVNRIEQMAAERPLDTAVLSDPPAFVELNLKSAVAPNDKRLGFRVRDASDLALTIDVAKQWGVSSPEEFRQDLMVTSSPVKSLSLQLGGGQQKSRGVEQSRQRGGISWGGVGAILERYTAQDSPTALNLQVFAVAPAPLTYAYAEISGLRKSHRLASYTYFALADVQDRLEAYGLHEENLGDRTSSDLIGINNYVRHGVSRIGSMKHQLGLQCRQGEKCTVPTLDSTLAMPRGNSYFGLQYEYLTRTSRGDWQWAFYPRQRLDVSISRSFQPSRNSSGDRFSTRYSGLANTFATTTLHLETGYRPMIYANLTRSFTVEKMVAPSVQLGAIWQTRPLRMVGSFQSYLREKERGESFMLSVQWELGGGVRMVSERLQKSSVSGRVLSSTSLKPLDKADVRCIGDKNEGLSISQTNKDGVFVLQSARLSSCASFEVIYQGITKKFPSSALPESDIAIKFPDRSVVYISFYEDKNSNNALDEDDPQVKLENYIAEIGEGIVQADQGTFVDGTLTVPRKKKVGFTATSQYLPAGFISLQFIPEWVDSYSEDFVDLKVLLKKQ